MQIKKLPSPIVLSMSLTEVLGHRRSSREFSTQRIDAPLLTSLLWACAGQTLADGHRTVPSAMDSRECLAFVFDEAGVWRYEAAENALICLSEGDQRAVTTSGQDFVTDAPVTLIFGVDSRKCANLTGPMGETCKKVDAGAMMQTALLACTAMGLTAVARASYDPEAIKATLGEEGQYIDPVIAVTCGFAP